MQPELTPDSETWEQKARRLALELKELRCPSIYDKAWKAGVWYRYRNKRYELMLHIEAVE